MERGRLLRKLANGRLMIMFLKLFWINRVNFLLQNYFVVGLSISQKVQLLGVKSLFRIAMNKILKNQIVSDFFPLKKCMVATGEY